MTQNVKDKLIAVGCTVVMLAFILLFTSYCYKVIGQKIENFVLVGKADGNAYLVDTKDVRVKGKNILFVGLAGTSIGFEDGNEIIDSENFMYSIFEGDCSTLTYSELTRHGVWKGEKFKHTFEKPEQKKATKPQVIFYAMEKVCKMKSEVYE